MYVICFARPGTQRTEDEAPPMVWRDEGFIHLVDAKDRGSQTNLQCKNSVATEGLNRYNRGEPEQGIGGYGKKAGAAPRFWKWGGGQILASVGEKILLRYN